MEDNKENHDAEGKLELRLKEIGIDSKISLPVVRQQDKPTLIDFIRKSSSYKAEVNNSAEKYIPFSTIGERIGEIGLINRAVEDAVSLEILGIRNDFIGKAIYKLKRAIRRDSSTAEQIIYKQIGRVTKLGEDLSSYSRSLDSRIEKLEDRYGEIVSNLVGRSKEINEINEKLAKAKDLIPYLTSALDNAKTEEENLKLKVAEREIRRKIISWTDYISKNEGVKEFLGKEQKILDGLSTICSSYSSTLKNILQHTDLMNKHLITITPVYLDMIRSRHVNGSLTEEFHRLGDYVARMNNAFQRGLDEVVYKANDTGFGGNLLTSVDNQISGTVAKIEEKTFKTLNNFEERISNYSKKLKGGSE